MSGGKPKMKPLKLRTPKTYDYTAQSGIESLRRTFFCVSEGPTEESYFKGIKNSKRKLNIKNEVHIEIVEKEEGFEGYSHPEQLVMACLRHMGRIDEEGNDIPEKEWENHKIWKDFEPETDLACVIFDRDYRGLKIDNLYETCQKHGIFIAISNPNFELWLLMHFPNIEKHDRDTLLANQKNVRHQLFTDASKDKKYLEIVLSRAAIGYKKGAAVKFEDYVDGLPLALEQAKLYCEDYIQLKDKLGTSVGNLIKKIKE